MKINNYLVNIAFDGYEFNGTQKQPKGLTVQGVIEEQLTKLYGEKIRILCCSRLDSKVSALDYYFSFNANDKYSIETITNYLNRMTPSSILVKEVKEVSMNFDAYHTPHMKEYVYGFNLGIKNPLFNRYFYYVDKHMDLNLFKQALKLFEGKHDFSSFASLTDNRIKDQTFIGEIFSTSIDEKEDGNLILVHIQGKNFYRYEVRMILGACLNVALGKYNLDWIKDKLVNPSLLSFKIKLPAYPLILYKTTYVDEGGETC